MNQRGIQIENGHSSKKKVISVVGARPNFMKVAPIDRSLKKYSLQINHMIVHTGQHYDEAMSDSFFRDLEMPKPSYFLGAGSGSHGEQTAKIILEFEKVCVKEKPDLVLVVGDVNSTIACALTAVKLGIKVAHVEGGLRSGDRTMPEEINRRATDSISDFCFVTEQSGLDNLKNEGFNPENIFLVGNTMIDSQLFAMPKAMKTNVLDRLKLKRKEYILVTLHRPSNVDDEERLRDILEIFKEVSPMKQIFFPAHPRTKKNINNYGLNELIKYDKNIIVSDPVGYVDFLALMMNSDFVLTDSGGIQEETSSLGIHCLTARTSTERPITIELGTNRLVRPDKTNIIEGINKYLKGDRPQTKGAIPYWDGKASERITNIILDKILMD